jgi:glycosyltransferase involved in cell wall biosynthesis
MARPLVTVVIPNHNYARFLGAAIESALDQTYARIEVVVVDDGSTDDSRGVIASFGKRIRSVLQENGGQSSANLAGWRAAKGDILLFLDADDALRRDAVERVVGAIGRDTAAVQFCLATIGSDGEPLGGIYPPLPADWTPERIRETLLRSGFYPFPPTSGNAYPRWFLERVLPYDPQRYARGMDGLLAAVAPLYGKVVVLPEALGYYRIHGSNMGALEALDPDRFAYFVELDRLRAEFLEEHARRTRTALPANLLDRAFFHLQYRIASLKLRPDRHPYREDRLPHVTMLLMRAAAVAPEPPLTRVLVALWGAVVALAPRRLAANLVASRFIAGRRPALVEGVLRRLGLVRRGRAEPAPRPRENYALGRH